MKTRIKGLGIAAFAAMLIFVLTACKEPDEPPPPPPPPVDSIINIAAIQGVTPPAKDGIPVTAITANAQYSGTVTWSPNHSTFAAATQYTATIMLTAKAGFTLQGVRADFFTVAGATQVNNAANSGVVTAVFSATNANVINKAAIQGVTIPVKDGTPVTAITENTQYSGIVTWSPDHPTFAAATQYTATITLTAKAGYTLQGVSSNFFTVDGATSVVFNVNSGIVTAEFPSTDATVINIAAIQGVNVPENGRIPVANITENAQYIGTVTWSPSHSTFAAITEYTATISLTPKAGYTLQGVGANFFTVNGATQVSNNANSGVVTAVFPQTAETVINISAIQGVTAPTTGATPVANITENAQYNGTVTWSGNPSTFAAVTQYTATITLTAKTGYTLQGVRADFFTVAGATQVRNYANSGVITAVFPVTAAIVVDISAIQGVTAPVVGASPVANITENAQYSGTVTWSSAEGPVSGTFAADKAYTATIRLTAKTGYTLQGLGTNFFTVAGATSVSFNVNNGVITAVFPKTDVTTPVSRFEYYWVDQHGSLVTTSNNATTVAAGETLIITAQSSGYVVKHWYLNGVDTGQSGNTYNFLSITAGKHTVGLFVEKDGKIYNTNIIITVNKVTVTYNINGGTGTTPETQTVNAGSSVTLPSGSGLTRTGYTFGGWNIDTTGTGTNYNAGSSYTPTYNITLYARWNSTVTFNVNGGTGTAPASQTVPAGSSIILPNGNGLSKTGCIFGGWNTNTSGTGTNYDANSSYTPTGNIILYVSWCYTVTFDINGGTGTAPVSQIVVVGSSITLPNGDGFNRPDDTFGGWNIDASGTGINYDADSSYSPTGNITLYAKWHAPGTEANPYVLTARTWTNGSITSSDSVAWYSFSYIRGSINTYYIWWNDSKQGNSTKTLDIRVDAFFDGEVYPFTSNDSAYNNPQSLSKSVNGTVLLKVSPRNSGDTGTFAIVYSNNGNVRP